MVLKGKIETTEAKAKAVKGQIDKVVSWARKRTLIAQRELLKVLDNQATKKLIEEIAPNLGERSSGFTRVVKKGPRKGDNAPMVLLQWVELEKIIQVKKEEPGLKIKKMEKMEIKSKKSK